MFVKARLAFTRCPLGFWGTEHGPVFYYSVVKKFSNPPTEEDIKKFYEIKSELIGKKVLPECDACAMREIADFLRYCKEQMNDDSFQL